MNGSPWLFWVKLGAKFGFMSSAINILRIKRSRKRHLVTYYTTWQWCDFPSFLCAKVKKNKEIITPCHSAMRVNQQELSSIFMLHACFAFLVLWHSTYDYIIFPESLLLYSELPGKITKDTHIIEEFPIRVQFGYNDVDIGIGILWVLSNPPKMNLPHPLNKMRAMGIVLNMCASWGIMCPLNAWKRNCRLFWSYWLHRPFWPLWLFSFFSQNQHIFKR